MAVYSRVLECFGPLIVLRDVSFAVLHSDCLIQLLRQP